MQKQVHENLHITEDDFRHFVGKDADTYISRWDAMDHSDNRIRWHFTAGVFFVFWLLYRKMYLYSIILLIAVAVSVNLVAFLFSPETSMIVGMGAVVFMGLYGNHMYRAQATRKIRDVLAESSDPEERKRLLEARGGVTFVPHLVFILMLMLGYLNTVLR